MYSRSSIYLVHRSMLAHALLSRTRSVEATSWLPARVMQKDRGMETCSSDYSVVKAATKIPELLMTWCIFVHAKPGMTLWHPEASCNCV
jgi:hypothetical protein